MENRDIKLFNQTIHNVKTILYSVKNEREMYHITLAKMLKEHDEEVNGLIAQLMDVIDELNELIIDLIGEEPMCEICKKKADGDNMRCILHLNRKLYKKEKC